MTEQWQNNDRTMTGRIQELQQKWQGQMKENIQNNYSRILSLWLPKFFPNTISSLLSLPCHKTILNSPSEVFTNLAMVPGATTDIHLCLNVWWAVIVQFPSTKAIWTCCGLWMPTEDLFHALAFLLPQENRYPMFSNWTLQFSSQPEDSWR